MILKHAIKLYLNQHRCAENSTIIDCQSPVELFQKLRQLNTIEFHSRHLEYIRQPVVLLSFKLSKLRTKVPAIFPNYHIEFQVRVIT